MKIPQYASMGIHTYYHILWSELDRLYFDQMEMHIANQ